MKNYEKLGVFYLGKTFDFASRTRKEEPTLYDSKDLLTHAVIIGMTGSGNTGLGIGMIEEALITTSNIEDIMVLIWTIGELNFINFKNKLKYFCSHPHGNIRRMAFSAMGKMGLEEFLPYLINGLKDKKPQVKQYAIIAFGKISKEDSIERLYSIINDKNEKEYIKRAAEQSIEQIISKARAGDNNEGT